MSRAALVLVSDAIRAKAHAWIDRAPPETRVEFKQPKRTVEQNALMWPLLSDIASQKRHAGLRLSAEDWKQLFMDALNREARLVPNLDGNGFVNLGRSSSDLSKQEFSDLIEVIRAWGAANGVVFHEERKQ